LNDVINLGEQVITSRFPDYNDFSTPKTPIVLSMCSECGLLQLKQTIDSQELYEHEYGYRSGISNTMRSHLKKYQEEILSKVELVEGDIIVDIGSNDSTMLQYYDKKYTRVGIDPTGKQFREYYGDVNLIADYFTKANFQKDYGKSKCKIVSSISMFYDLPDPVQFAKDIHDILDDDGIWTCEQSYVVTMLEQNSFDTICHEHLEYYALHQIKLIADKANLKIIDVVFNDCNGGSFRIYFAKKNSLKHVESVELIKNILFTEAVKGIMSVDIYRNFMKNCDNEMKKLCDFIDLVKENGEETYLYGASTKGNCLLQYADISYKDIKYAVERNPKKIGKMTATGIEIIGEEEMRKTPPAYLLVLPWHFRDEIIERESEYLSNGGQLIFPLPHFEIFSKKTKVLVTGCEGHIASYFLETHLDTINYYGIGHRIPEIPGTLKSPQNIIKTYFDLNNTTLLESYILTVKPDAIVHLAGISSSIKAFHQPTDTLKTNGLVVVNICEIIHKNKLKTKLFNASSSEIYKGHVKYVVKEDDNNMFHQHPYSIAKIAGHSTVDFYRNTHQLPFFNGIIFTTESPRKSCDFLLNKVARHIMRWKINGVRQTLRLGNLESFRNILHAKDAADAIHCIIQQEHSTNYLICGYSSFKIYDVVMAFFENSGIKTLKNDKYIYDIDVPDIPVIIFEGLLKEIDTEITDIQGYPQKLLEIGWKPKYDIKALIGNIIDENIDNGNYV
jgi:GDP-mannose 4,6-dehydratase